MLTISDGSTLTIADIRAQRAINRALVDHSIALAGWRVSHSMYGMLDACWPHYARTVRAAEHVAWGSWRTGADRACYGARDAGPR